MIGYAIAWALVIPTFKRNIYERHTKSNDEHVQYQSRLWWYRQLHNRLHDLCLWSLCGVCYVGQWMGKRLPGCCLDWSGDAIVSKSVSPFFTGTPISVVLRLDYPDIGGKYHLEYASTILCKGCHCCPLFATILMALVCNSVPLVGIYYLLLRLIFRKRLPLAQQLLFTRAEVQE